MTKTNQVKLEWDGEGIKQTINVPEQRLSPKDIIDSIDNVQNTLNQINDQKKKMKDNVDKLDNDFKSASSFLFDRQKFERKCIDVCIDKLKMLMKTHEVELIKKAKEEAEEIIAKDTNAYTDQMIKNQKYVIFQKLFATHPKVAKEIPARLIRDLVYDKPFYNNPFK